MADYQKFVEDKPVIADNGDIVINNTRENLMALRDAIVVGVLVKWNMTQVVGGGSEEEPDELLYSDNSTTQALRLEITWASNNATVIVYSYTPDDTPTITWHIIGTLTNTYNGNGTLTASSWS